MGWSLPLSSKTGTTEAHRSSAFLGYTNNLAGATWEQSISMEMQATATMCDSQARELRIQVDALEKELRELQSKQ